LGSKDVEGEAAEVVGVERGLLGEDFSARGV
jgi:hypothetical protein